jgi:hypothetical protein
MDIQVKDMILNITLEDNRVRIFITDINGLMIRDDGYHDYIPDSMGQDYFDNWETMIRNLPWTNITQVNRFI